MIQMAARSTLSVSGRSLAENVGSNPAGGHGCLSGVLCVTQVQVSATGRSPVQRSPTVYVCLSLSVIRCNSKPLHLQCVGSRGQTRI